MSTQAHAFNFGGPGVRSHFHYGDGEPAVEGGQ
jgi:hypothetical protein